jgi:hypothetical protein
MKIITSQKLIQKYNQGVLDSLNKFNCPVDVLPDNSYAAVKAHCDSINDDIVIFGGNDIIPFGVSINPASDNDGSVETDNLYAATNDPTGIIPNKVVTRIPDEQMGAGVDYVEKVIENQLKWQTNLSPNKGWLNITANAWKGISDYMVEKFNMGDQNISPPVQNNGLPQEEFLTKLYGYINLHGGKSVPNYYGQQGGNYPIALMPQQSYYNGSLIFGEACYGAYIDNRNRNTSIPLMALYSGVLAWVGSTTTAYGPANPPAACADLLCECFYEFILQGQTFGQAFLNAKNEFAKRTIQRQGSLDPEAKKTLLQFVAYGMPNIKFV